ncbi:MAG: hypothetical protein K8R56_05425 [Candidatus Eisenbacteria bacterium]|nr:hypothetical protein [Candidatus Eisenbacteria bacterium]
MRLARGIVWLLLAALALVAAPRARAQSFGHNKVHYESLEWRVLETPHLLVHFYAEEESLARSLAAFAESVTVEYDGRFHLSPKSKVPLLLYSTHHLFQQSNATSSILSESVGGLTELIKGRVLIPHNGSWSRLAWVTRHELAHWYMLVKLNTVMREHKRATNWLPDLWFTEGFAEYLGTTWDEEAEGLLRDMVLSRTAYPLTQSEPITGSVMMYKEGQSFLLWLAERYGDARIFDLFENAWQADDFSTAYRITFGRKLEDDDREWFEGIQKRYFPVVADARRAREVARPWRQPSRFNLAPRALAPATPGDTALSFCWFEVGEGSIDLVVSEPVRDSLRRERRLLRGGASAAFESFHLFQNRPATSACGLIALTAKRGGRDALYLIDPKDGRIVRRVLFPQLVAVHDPALAADGRSVIFAAQSYDGDQDLYRVSWRDGEPEKLERLTRDGYDDVEPTISPDGRWVAWASDRGDLAGRYSLWRMSLAGGAPEPVSRPKSGDDRQPAYSPDGAWLAYRSTRGGTSDLWVRPAEPSYEARRVTRLQGLASDPDWLPDGRGLLFTAQEAVTFRTWSIAFAPDSLSAESEAEPTREPVLPTLAHQETAQEYRRRLGLDIIQNGVSFDPGFNGQSGYGQIAVSDLLGNEQFMLTLANDSENFGNFWDGWEGGLTYLNQSKRLNYGLGVFRLTRLYDPDFDLVRREKRLGMVGVVSYPLSLFTRIEGSVQVRHATNHLLRRGGTRTVDLVSNFVSFVHDDSRWWWDGPTGGSRLNLTAGFTRDMTSGVADYGTLLAEVRHYRQPFRRVVLAGRAQWLQSFGSDAQKSYLGGPMRLRIDQRRVISGLQLVNTQVEARFPVLRGIVLAVPAPWQLPTLHVALFADAAWASGEENRDRVADGGFALYLGGGFFPQFRWNWVWRSDDFKHLTSPKPTTFFTLDFGF